MRGRATRSCFWQLLRGITPAYAGKSVPLRPLGVVARDHPRVCGEEPAPAGQSLIYRGSPPRMRGRGIFATLALRVRGITPAYAGKRQSGEMHLHQARDHPRVCGEEFVLNVIPNSIKGSPPRMRGRETWQAADRLAFRITPAYAGKRLKKFHSIGHFSCILCLFHSVLHRASASGGSRAGPCAPPCLPAQNAIPV